MQQLKPTIFPRGAERDLIDDKGRWQVGQIALHGVTPCEDILLLQPTRQGQVEAKFFHHIGIAPFRQKRLLPRAQTRRMASGQFGVGRGRAEWVEASHAGLRRPLQSGCIPLGCEGKETTQRRQHKASAGRRRKTGREISGGRFQIFNCLTFGQMKGRFERPVKSVFARCHGNVMQTGHIQLVRLAPPRDVPAQPRRAELCQRAVWRQIINCKSRV